ncbi:histidine phosphatase family protein [Rhodobacteraceae bacterium SC52]|nr:histidine phosphatase family protein [Rhodobacteraceae bacterium SC52]
MSLRLILMRHAKSDWSDDVPSDHERILNQRGRDACDAIGPWLADHNYETDLTLCSDAARTRETWQRVSEHLKGAHDLKVLPQLYLASATTLLNEIRACGQQSVTVVAHNPGIGNLANGLVTSPPSHSRFVAFPTLSTLIVEFPSATWSEIEPRSGQVIDFIVPRDLTD